ncbi:hypothetical protein ACLFMI_09175 [Pseudonocardia nantongensis]|uniref:hypothetical protein n=1 Tax=Pseudonocardia nantongensis TaxID=1181885 RepID=UPI00397CA5D6
MLMTHIPMDHLTSLAQERRERLLAEAAAERLARTARPGGRRSWLRRVLRLAPARPRRPDPDAGRSATDHDLCA